VPRSHTLWRYFDGPEAIIRRNDWIDGPSIGIAFSYLLLGSELGSVLAARGDASAADSVFRQVRRVARAVRVEAALDDAAPPERLGDTAR
jgi:hypothetical protein